MPAVYTEKVIEWDKTTLCSANEVNHWKEKGKWSSYHSLVS